ncbi:hypothetical protein AGMMS49983_15150 [Clostridia bacterium]|nr:hypothetical protein AGMMS49983_15150 [Clostridia bacterium]
MAISGVPTTGRKTIWHLQQKKNKGEKLTQISPGALDPIFAAAADRADIDILRYTSPGESTQHMSDNLGWWTRYTRERAPHIHLNTLVPTHFYADKYTAVKECSKLINDGADSVLPIGIPNDVVEYLTLNHVPVFGHVGILSSWQVTNIGGFRRVGKTAEEALVIYRQAYEYQESGMKAMTIELTPREISHAIAKKLHVPVINIAGSDECDGSELVIYDLLKLVPEETMGIHAKVYGDFYGSIGGAFKAFGDEVRSGAYPAEHNGWTMDEKEYDKFLNLLENA